jgi:fructokinase
LSKKYLCVGEILWDALPKGLFLGGAPFNVACHLKMLGEEVAFASCVGTDTLGNQAIKRIKNKNLSSDLIQIDEKNITGIVDVNIDENKNAAYTIVEPVAWDFIKYTSLLENISNSFDILIYGTLAQRNKTTRETIEKLRKANSVKVYDINLRTPFIDKEIVKKSLLDANIVKMNDEEMKIISEWFGINTNLESGIRELSDKFNCDTICVTQGANGSTLLFKNEIISQKGFKVNVVDTVGSGDAFLAALLNGIFNNKEINKTLEFANAVGAYVASKDGATPIINLEVINKIILQN